MNIKKIFTILFSITLFVFLISVPLVTSAASNGTITYYPLAPVAVLGIGESMVIGGDKALVVYFDSIAKIMIMLATGLAVLYVVYGGVQYSMTDSFAAKGEGKKTIQRALGGLLLALTSWLILNTINPTLLTGEIKGLVDVTATVSGGAAGVKDPGIVTIPGGSSGGTPVTGSTGTGTVSGGSLNQLQETAEGYYINPSNVALDTDGRVPPPFNDPDYLPHTSYQPGGQDLNANTDYYVVVPIDSGIPNGTKVLVTDHTTGKSVEAVVGDRGPAYGEISLATAQYIGAWTPGMGNSISSHNISYNFYTK
ncbi:MAG: hypothetical protein V4664_01765 [Patescibacteria group bacterium]